ncbi:MAG: SCP2 sterol-binding domain-containing protein [Acidimicrobiales bacterium]
MADQPEGPGRRRGRHGRGRDQHRGREQLTELLEGQSDEEITTFVEALGADAVLEQIFGAMSSQFDASKANGQSAVVQWDIAVGGGTTSYTVTVDNGVCTATPGPAESPRLTLALALPDFMRFIAGQLDGMQAFMGGKLKLAGDMMFATQMQTWFGA